MPQVFPARITRKGMGRVTQTTKKPPWNAAGHSSASDVSVLLLKRSLGIVMTRFLDTRQVSAQTVDSSG